jgi:hypothetical protein
MLAMEPIQRPTISKHHYPHTKNKNTTTTITTDQHKNQ